MNSYVLHENKIRKNISPKIFLWSTKQELPCQTWNVFLKNTTTWKIKFSTSSLNLCAPNKHAQITVLEATKMKQKSSMNDGIHIETASRGVLWKKVFLDILKNSRENTCARVSFFIKLQALAFNFIKKETLAQVFSCEFCEISKSTFLQSNSGRLLLYTRMVQLWKMWKDANQLRMRVLSRNSGS